jgi:hypothetical protein
MVLLLQIQLLLHQDTIHTIQSSTTRVLSEVKRFLIVPLGDNTAATAWQHKGSATSSSPTAYSLQVSSLHQWHYRYLSKADYIAGPMHQMADDCSRLWHLSDSQLLAYFN